MGNYIIKDTNTLEIKRSTSERTKFEASLYMIIKAKAKKYGVKELNAKQCGIYTTELKKRKLINMPEYNLTLEYTE